MMTVYKLAAAIFLTLCAEATAQTSFWPNSAVPATKEVRDNSVTLGLKFYSDVPGTVTGVRFYKGSSNNGGTHVGTLWSSSGAKLASVTFSGETSYGWQQANFSSPVSIAANTTYVISYSAPYGYYACDQYYRWTYLSASPLHVSGTSPGVYAYGSGALFPTSAWNSSNYYVDVVFKASGSTTPPPTSGTYSISGTVSGAAAVTVTLSGAVARTATTNSLGQFTFSSLPNGSYVAAASKSGYTFTPSTRSITINGASITGSNFTGTAVANPVPHTVSLRWNASTSTNLKGYYVYRADVAGGAYAKLNATPVSTTSYADRSVASGRTYYYVTTAVDTNNIESAYSNQATAVVPSP
jgi:hypothetical protein